jgi:hypothetical protein
MKYCLLISLTTFSFYLTAQECVLQKSKDAYSGKHSLSTGFFSLRSFTLSIDITQKEIDYFFVMKELRNKCFDDFTTATFVQEGGKQKFLLRNKGSMNCEGILHLVMSNNTVTPSALQKMTAKRTIAIKLSYADGSSADIKLDSAAQELLLKQSICVAKEAKTIL